MRAMYGKISQLLESLAIESTILGAQHFKDKYFQWRDLRTRTLFVQEDNDVHYTR